MEEVKAAKLILFYGEGRRQIDNVAEGADPEPLGGEFFAPMP